MKRFLPFFFALTIYACSANPAVTASVSPTDTPPTETPTVLPPTPIPELKVMDGYGDGLSELTLKNIAGGMYDAQIEGLKTSYKIWTEDGSLMVEGTPQIGFMQDQNNDPKGVYAGVLIGDTYVFPPLSLEQGKIPSPAYDATDKVNAPLKIKKTLTIDDVPNLMEAGYTEEMANWLVKNAPDFAVRGRQFVRMKNNKVTAYLGPEGQWVKEETRFEIVPEFTDKMHQGLEKPLWLDQVDVDNNDWLFYVMRNTKSVAPDLSKIIWRPISGGQFLSYQDPMEEMTPVWLEHPETRMSRRVSWAATDSSYPDSYGFPFDTVRAVVFYNPDGSMVWMKVRSMSNPGVVNPEDLPRYDLGTTVTGLTTSVEEKAIYDKWINSGNPPWVPAELEYKTTYRFAY